MPEGRLLFGGNVAEILKQLPIGLPGAERALAIGLAGLLDALRLRLALREHQVGEAAIEICDGFLQSFRMTRTHQA